MFFDAMKYIGRVPGSGFNLMVNHSYQAAIYIVVVGGGGGGGGG